MLKFKFPFLIVYLLFLTSCSDVEIGSRPPLSKSPDDLHTEVFDPKKYEEGGTTIIEDLTDDLFGAKGGGVGIGVNVHLWKASLDTLSFMPLSSADPFGGVIITDWYSNAGSSEEKFKIIAYITGTVLRVDALKITVFKKIRDENGDWIDQTTSKDMATRIENSVFTKAKEYRIKKENSEK